MSTRHLELVPVGVIFIFAGGCDTESCNEMRGEGEAEPCESTWTNSLSSYQLPAEYYCRHEAFSSQPASITNKLKGFPLLFKNLSRGCIVHFNSQCNESGSINVCSMR